jgi:short-subunit dehydrogenase
MSSDRGFALVTGASQGIGRAIALELARNGFGILATGRNSAGLKELEDEVRKNNGRIKVLEVDLLADGAVDHVVAFALQNGPITCLVNNAGQANWGLFEEQALDVHLRMMKLNMEVPVQLTHKLLPHLKEQKQAYILNVSSMTAFHALASMAIYAASKAFLLRWSRSLRLELKGRVNVTAVCPGSVNTGFTKNAGMLAMDDLAKKFGTPPEPVAKAAVAAMLKNKAMVIPGASNQFTVKLQKLVPTSLTEGIASGIYLKRLQKKV